MIVLHFWHVVLVEAIELGIDGVFQIRHIACWVEQFPWFDATFRLACFENQCQGIETSEDL